MLKNIPSEKMQKAGNDIAEVLFNISVHKHMVGTTELSGPVKVPKNKKWKKICKAYRKNKIDSITAIYMAMRMEEE